MTRKVNSIYGDVSREGLLATGALLLGAGGDIMDMSYGDIMNMSNGDIMSNGGVKPSD